MAELLDIPFSMEAEEAVIGSILIDGECISEVIDILSPNDFMHEDCRNIYKIMVELKDGGEGINQITVAVRLQKFAEPGVAYLSYLISMTPTSMDVKHYADVVRRSSFYRQLLGVSSQIAKIAIEQDPNIKAALDKSEAVIQDLRQDTTTESRRLALGKPRLIETNPPRYIWNVNGKDLRLTLSQITQWGKFKNVVIAELNFVPIRPKDWDDTINTLITHSLSITAPADASEEQQLKILIQRWFTRMREAGVYSDLSVGRHIIKEVKGIEYYFFQSTPLIEYLKKEYKRSLNSEDLWVSVHKWRGIRWEVRVPTPTGSMGAKLWGIPIDFVEEDKKGVVPDWF